MTTTRWASAHPFSRMPVRPLAAIAAVVGLVLVIVLSPNAGRVEASDVFGSLRSPGQAAFIAGHRGDKADAPENTLPAFRAAIESRVEFLEADLQRTSDGVPVLMHDWTLDRTTNGTGPVWNTSWKKLRTLDAGSWYSAEFAGTPVPTLDDLLDLMKPSDARLLLELKGSWTAEQLVPVREQIYSHRLQQRVIVAGFDIHTLAAAASVAPDVQRVVITREVVGDPAILAATCGAVAIVTSRAFLEGDRDAVDRIHDAGLGVLGYTLNTEESWAHAVAMGVDGIITDKPGELGEWLSSAPVADGKALQALDTLGR